MTYRGHIQNGVAVLDTPVALPDGTPVRIEVASDASEFWKNRSVEQLACEQAVKRIETMDDLAGDWPTEDSIDEFLASIREVRR